MGNGSQLVATLDRQLWGGSENREDLPRSPTSEQQNQSQNPGSKAFEDVLGKT